MPNSKEVSVIIVNYRSEKYLRDCLASIFEKFNPEINFEIIIVNNDSQEPLKDISAEFTSVKILNHQKNIGFGAANNIGAREAMGRYLLFLNPDTEINTFNWAKIFKKFKENDEVAAIGPRLLTEKKETQWWCAGKELTLWQVVKNNLGAIESKKIWDSKTDIYADWVSGAALFTRKEIFDKIGGFDEKFFMYAEDMDLCRRMRELGFKILFYPSAPILHKGGKSRESLLSQKAHFFKSTILYIVKWLRNNHSAL